MNVFRRFWNWLIKVYNERNEPKYEIIVAKAPSGPEPPTPNRVQHKPRKAIHQDYGRFFKGKGARPTRTYRRSVKAKIQPDDGEW